MGVNEVHLQLVAGTGQSKPQHGGQRLSQGRDSGQNSSSPTGTNVGCYICGDPVHTVRVNEVHLQPVAGAGLYRLQQGGQRT
jgi:hypothetical protein